MKSISVGIAGATGRMGAALLAAVARTEGFVAAVALVRPDSHGPAGVRTVESLDALLGRCDVVVDFSRPALLAELAPACAAAGRPLVSGTTGLGSDLHRVLKAAAARIPIVYAPNMSIGINVLVHLVEKASETLGEEWSCEVFEAHHAQKVDAPSGTALRLGAAVEHVRGAGAVTYAVAREGDTVGFHELRFAGPGERIVLAHEAFNRNIFAQGALRAARWVVDQAPGLYGMDDVLALKSR